MSGRWGAVGLGHQAAQAMAPRVVVVAVHSSAAASAVALLGKESGFDRLTARCARRAVASRVLLGKPRASVIVGDRSRS